MAEGWDGVFHIGTSILMLHPWPKRGRNDSDPSPPHPQPTNKGLGHTGRQATNISPSEACGEENSKWTVGEGDDDESQPRAR